MLSLDFINTVAFAGLVLFLGHAVRRVAPFLSRYNVPAPVIGGLIVSVNLTLLVVPCFYSLMARFESEGHHQRLREALEALGEKPAP